MTTTQNVIDSAWSKLYTRVRVERDKLATTMTAGATSMVNTRAAGGIVAGAQLSIDLEDFYVASVSGNTATVEPASNGSTAAGHTSGAKIWVNAEFTPWEIFQEINNELASLSSPTNGLFQVKTVELTYSPVTYGYDITGSTDIIEILKVQEQYVGPSKNWREVTNYRFEQNQDTGVFPSGNAIFTPSGFPGQKILVVYGAPFSPLTSLTDNVLTVTGLQATAHDILALGAVMRCAFPTEIDRNQSSSQASGRRQAEVPAGARLNAAKGIAALRAQRIREESNRLTNNYPIRVPRRQ